jgi:hypothetical protein
VKLFYIIFGKFTNIGYLVNSLYLSMVVTRVHVDGQTDRENSIGAQQECESDRKPIKLILMWASL